ncbi:type III secretion system cytoplasmic ring protein SctQ [Pseudooceanicola aestuarii]|uniref:type III secretion system cytoplasmic ring protein SctQ n=1 Tax=Pseudooceanicola aestuarii TaxID=2697319 RepID=UPI0013D86522|nr:type III secretion system cytoplasmic ring protein SctQ [Pseudooceanicola aestuarii]
MNALHRPLVSDIAIWNAIAAWFGQPVRLDQLGFTLVEARPPQGAVGALAATAETEAGTLTLVLQDMPLGAATGVDLALAELDDLPPDLREIVVSGVWDLLRQIAPAPLAARLLSVTPVAPGNAPPEARTWLSLQVDPGWGAPAVLLVGGSARCLTALAAGLVTSPGRPAPLAAALAAAIPVQCRIALGRIALPLAALRDLAPGDLLLTGTSAIRRELLAPRLSLILEPSGEGLIVKEIRMTDTDPETAPDLSATAPDDSLPETAAIPPADDTPLTRLDDLPVQVSVVLDDRQMSLAELQALTPGALVPLGDSTAEPGKPVRLLANGRTIGAGNLVEIDGTLAVRIADIVTG